MMLLILKAIFVVYIFTTLFGFILIPLIGICTNTFKLSDTLRAWLWPYYAYAGLRAIWRSAK